MSRKIYGPDFAKPPTQPGQRPFQVASVRKIYLRFWQRDFYLRKMRPGTSVCRAAVFPDFGG